jgi:hypothetical protein
MRMHSNPVRKTQITKKGKSKMKSMKIKAKPQIAEKLNEKKPCFH